MMSQISKNSAGARSAAMGAESTLLFGQATLAASPNKASVISSGVIKATVPLSTNNSLAGPKSGLSQPGVLTLNPSMVASIQQHQQKTTPPPGLMANQMSAVSTGAELSDEGGAMTGASGATATTPLFERLQQAQLQQQFEQLHLVGVTLDEKSCQLANTKEKTPMCLINELARFSKVQHQYTLMDEQGPAHKKTFFVKLKLGEEDYTAHGPSIKKAQHSAAASALNSTKLKHPPLKPPRPMAPGNENSVTPTVELNALAMKRGEPAIYKPIEPRHTNYYPAMDFRGMYNQRYHYPRVPRLFYTSLKVGPREFIGEGPTRQAARHMAATKALKVLRNLPLPNQKTPSDKDEEDETSEDSTDVSQVEVDEKDQLKSEISLVHEIALKRNLEVKFEVMRESGPPHMKVFVTQCTVGDEYKTEAQGNSKKLSKKQAAEHMLHELRHLPTISMVTLKQKPKPANNKKKNRNLIKVQKADLNYGVGINPISRLIQIMQAQKKKEPVYSLIAERGLPRRREFVMQVCVDDQTCTGVGPNKKLAKRSAAEAMLEHLGFSRPSPQPSKPALKSGYSEFAAGDKKVTFSDADSSTGTCIVNGKGGRQLMPGLLFLPDSNLLSATSTSPGPGLGTGASAGGDNLLVSSILSGHGGLRPEEQLVALAAAHNIGVDFDDFSGKECLCRVTLSSNPNHTVHGTGASKECARDAASLAALKQLAETGLLSVMLKTEKTEQMGSGDGPQVQTADVEKRSLSTSLAGNVPVVKSDTM